MLKELLNDHQTGMSEFQDDYLVTSRAGGTLYGQYKQALRELYKRFRGLRELTCDYEKKQVEIEIEKQKSETETDLLQQKLFDIEYRRKTMQLEETERLIKDTEREFKRFYQQSMYLKRQIGELTPEKRARLDQDMWEYKIKEMMCIDWITKGRLGTSTFEFIHSCPKDMKLRLFEVMGNQDELLEWYSRQETYLDPIKYDELLCPDFKQVNEIDIN